MKRPFKRIRASRFIRDLIERRNSEKGNGLLFMAILEAGEVHIKISAVPIEPTQLPNGHYDVAGLGDMLAAVIRQHALEISARTGMPELILKADMLAALGTSISPDFVAQKKPPARRGLH